MERKVGEIFEYNGEWYQCVERPNRETSNIHCELCDFLRPYFCCPEPCNVSERLDKKEVIFKKLEKVGEPCKSIGLSIANGITVQLYRTHSKPLLSANIQCCILNDNLIAIEIKQNKENMEEKKLNLKPFDLEAAKAGKPVCTRDGRKARIICFDAKRKDGKNIMALIPDKEYPGFEDLVAYPNNGNYHGGHENDGDLMMLPQKKEGWINLCKNNHGDTLAIGVFPSREEAVSNCPPSYLSTIKIEWEE